MNAFQTTERNRLFKAIATLNMRLALKSKGWSYRSAAPLLGVSYQHLSDVLNGKRHSRRLITAINHLQPRNP